MIQKADTLRQQGLELRAAFPSNGAIVAFNSGSDKACLSRSMKHNEMDPFDDIYWICAMKLARKLFPDIGKRSSLQKICELVDVAYPKDAHRAAVDTGLLAQVWFALLDKIEKEHTDIKTLDDLLRFSDALPQGIQTRTNHDRLLSEARTRDAVTTAINLSLATGQYSSDLSDAALLVEVHKASVAQPKKVLPCILTGKEGKKELRLVAVAGTRGFLACPDDAHWQVLMNTNHTGYVQSHLTPSYNSTLYND